MFYKAMTSNDRFTENGMPTHSTSGNAIVDLFFTVGASRKLDVGDIEVLFSRAFSENALLAVRTMFYNRDVRGGQGERRSFRIMLYWLARNKPELAQKVLSFVPEYGRWDDLFTVFGTALENNALEMISSALRSKNRLCAKWMPREGKKGWNAYGSRIMAYMKLTPRQYRKMLVQATDVVESDMCARNWDSIEYEHVPSVAHHKYGRAFGSHSPDRYAEYLQSVEKGEKKINASAIFPHTIVAECLGDYYSLRTSALDVNFRKSMDLQWKALPDYVPENLSFIPVCDVSGSMSGEPMAVSIALGIYLAERNKSAFKDMFFTFSRQPQLQKVEGYDLVEKVSNLSRAEWELNTNIEAMFNLLLDRAVKYNVPESDMPSSIVILSDMQFDECAREPSENVYELISRKYRDAGYKMPSVIFWNLRSSVGVPVKFDARGTALVSGFSPSVMKAILNGDMNPLGIVMNVLNSERYSVINL